MNGFPLISAFGLESLLTGLDDPHLWESALQKHWPTPDDPACLVGALRLSIGRRLEEGELPQGELNKTHAKMRGMVDIEEWAFERISETQLKVKPRQEDVAAGPPLLPGMGLAAILSGQIFSARPAQVVFIDLGITRSSRSVGQAVVYAGSSAPGVGEGSAHVWLRQQDGSWQPTSQCIARWII